MDIMTYNKLTSFEQVHINVLVSDWLLKETPLTWVYIDWRPLLSQTSTKDGLQYLRPTEYAAILNIHRQTVIARDSLTRTTPRTATNF